MILPRFESGLLPVGEGAVKPFVRMGSGPRSIVVVPGAADGLRRCVDLAQCLGWFYRERAKSCRILIVSRRDPIPPEFGVEKHAEDLITTLEELGWGPVFLECISGGGPIGQQVAVKRPDLALGLILSSTFDYTCDQTRKVMQQWMEVAQQRAGLEALIEMVEQKLRPPPEIVLQMGGLDPRMASTPRSPQRLTTILLELMETDQREMMPRITCPALVLCGENDRIVPASVQREMAGRLPRGRLVVCPGFGHFIDTDYPAYEELVQAFVRETESGGQPRT